MNTYKKMDPMVKANWVAALRSGEYQQAQNALRRGERDSSFCCLGVVCDLEFPEEWHNYDPVEGVWELIEGNTGALPDTVRLKIGLDDDAESELMRLNDRKKANFSEIADWIEDNL